MLFPKSKMSYTSTYEGKKSGEGWLILNIGNMDLEGVNKIYIDLSDVDGVKAQKSKESDALQEAKRLLGGE